LARLSQALEALEAAVEAGPGAGTAAAGPGAGAVNAEDIARRVDRIIDRLETVLGE
jgi:hypothetical protein